MASAVAASSTGSLPSGPSRRLMRSLTKNMLRHAQQFDRQPSLLYMISRPLPLIAARPPAHLQRLASLFNPKTSTSLTASTFQENEVGEVATQGKEGEEDSKEEGEGEGEGEETSEVEDEALKYIAQFVAKSKEEFDEDPAMTIYSQFYDKILGGDKAMFFSPVNPVSSFTETVRYFSQRYRHATPQQTEHLCDAILKTMHEISDIVTFEDKHHKFLSNKLQNDKITARKANPRAPLTKGACALKSNEIKEGAVLIAHPTTTNAYFKHSVVLITSYEKGKRAEGFILNMPTIHVAQCTMGDIQKMECVYYHGGPVDANMLMEYKQERPRNKRRSAKPKKAKQVQATSPSTATTTTTAPSDLETETEDSGNTETATPSSNQATATTTANENPHKGRLYVGRCVWSPNQLEDELRMGQWLMANIPDSIVCDRDPAVAVYNDALTDTELAAKPSNKTVALYDLQQAVLVYQQKYHADKPATTAANLSTLPETPSLMDVATSYADNLVSMNEDVQAEGNRLRTFMQKWIRQYTYSYWLNTLHIVPDPLFKAAAQLPASIDEFQQAS